MTKSVAGSRSILERIYVPALLLMIAAVSPALFQFAVVLVLVAALAIYYGPIEGIYYVDLGWRALWAVLAMLLAILLAVGVACVTGILNVFARDTWLTMRYVLSGWMLATPILYPIEFIPEGYRWIAYLNPLAPAVELFRWALLGYGNVQWHYVALCVAEILALLIVGLRFFARQQTRIFDHA
jgi:lipopolysaccharide transport system permease protein